MPNGGFILSPKQPVSVGTVVAKAKAKDVMRLCCGSGLLTASDELAVM